MTFASAVSHPTTSTSYGPHQIMSAIVSRRVGPLLPHALAAVGASLCYDGRHRRMATPLPDAEGGFPGRATSYPPLPLYGRQRIDLLDTRLPPQGRDTH
jgi:hypothetical protein